MLHRKIISTLLSAALILSLCSCHSEKTASSSKSRRTSTEETTTTEETTSSEEKTESSSETESSYESSSPETTSSETEDTTAASSSASGEATLEDQIKNLERVRSCEKSAIIQTGVPNQIADKYTVIFDMPLDWKEPAKGSFPLRTTFIFVDEKATNTFLCDGYNLYEMEFSAFDSRRDLSWFYNTNQVQMEHRFFGGSVPDGLSIDSLDYWEYLTAENAAEDFHFIITQFKKILHGKSMFTGASKGGQLTHMQSYFHPEDADVFVSFVAPGGSDQDAPGFFDYIYTEIGDTAYGKDKAKKYRDLVLEFQVEAIKHRDVLAPKYYQKGIEAGCIFTDFVTPDILFDMAVLEFATTTWQYFPDFNLIRNILDQKDSGGSEYLDLLLQLIYDTNPANVWAHNSEYFAYYVQAAKQNGEHEYDFSFLRAALEKDGSGAKLVVTEDMEKGLLFRMVFTPEQYQAFTFDPTLYNNMVKWSHETKSTVVMVYGAADVWYSVRLPDVTDNENIHIYTLPDASHVASFERMPKEMADEVSALLDPILKWE